MPELPEVETTLRGVAPHLKGAWVKEVLVREHRLRWPVPEGLASTLAGMHFGSPWRRAKYLLFPMMEGPYLLVHLGMSGSLRLVDTGTEWRRHDHIDMALSSGMSLRYHDPRRFGCLLLVEDPEATPLIAGLGPEPFDPAFDASWLRTQAKGKIRSIKSLIMDGRIVVGVGNIYANEALFRAGIRPATSAGSLSARRCQRLVTAIREVLAAAIAEGGTTLRDFVGAEGQPGYFRQVLAVYERAGEPCRICGVSIQSGRILQRASYWCPRCQR